MNILIVDSDPIFTTAMSAILRSENYEVAIAKDGREATQAIYRRRYELVIIDMLVDYNNGLEVVSNIRHNSACIETPIIAVSSIANEKSVSNWKFVGVDTYMEKPLNVSVLLQKVIEFSRIMNDRAA